MSKSNPSAGDRFKSTGRELDDATGFQYHRARYYDAAIGRWTQQDPIGFAAEDPNLYRFVGNGPTNGVDPSGLATDPVNEALDRLERRGRGLRAFTSVTQSGVSRQTLREVEPVAAATEAFTNNLASSEGLDRLQTSLDVVGTFEPTPFADLTNTGIHLLRGQWRDGGVTVLGVVPGVGDSAKLLKYTDEAADVVCSIAKQGDQIADEAIDLTRATKQSAVAPNTQFKLGKHGEMPSPRPGQQSHHGVMSAWMKKHFPGYDADKAPAVLMPEANHQATFGVYNKWRADMRQKMGSTFDWGKVNEPDMRALSEKMFDAAQVPPNIRQDYWAWFERMKGALTP